eukprot:jgi/Chlat1/818/Chrsp104S01276
MAAAAAAAALGGAASSVFMPRRWAAQVWQGGVRVGGGAAYGYDSTLRLPPTSARRVQWPSSGRPSPSQRSTPQPSPESESWREWDEREARLELERAEGRERERAEREGRRRDGGMKRRMAQQHREASVRAEQVRLDMERARQLREAKMRDRLSRATAAPQSRNQAAEFIRDEREVDEPDRRPRASTSYDGYDYYDDDLWPRDTRTGFGRWVAGLFAEPGMREQPLRTPQRRRYVDPRVVDEWARAMRKPTRAVDETDLELRFEETEAPRRRYRPRRVQQQRRKAPDFESIRAALLGEASPYELFNTANQRR